ncbi:MAG: ribonuclease H-like domain-containing protein [Tepidanaerobacteraceae bacterium]|nr:ribonuclease H-like domain-containing protein [Tepidanaerobacteraceae bacterium]
MNLYDKLKVYMGGGENRHGLQSYDRRTKSGNFLGVQKSEQIVRALNAAPVKNPLGEHLIAVNSYGDAFCHAGVKLSGIFEIPPEIIALIAKDSCYNGFNFMKSVFIDTETTGLAGGSGTYAFLIGTGYFEGRKFKLIQYFMRDYDEEPAVLHSLKSMVKEFESVVSFNGKAYDIPLLATRFLINRMENPLDKPFHLDLLSSARRLYKERLASVSLPSLEANLFSMEREGDISSFEIPSIYFKFLRDQDPNPLKPIFYHNRMDVLSMVTLIIKMAEALQNPFGSDSCAEQDFYCLGRLYEDMEMFEESIKSYSKALEITGVKEKAYIRLSLLYKRLGKWDAAQKLWIQMVQDNIHMSFALVELAKMYEHRTREYQKAEKAARHALELAYKKKNLTNAVAEQEIKDLKKRLARIMSKQGKPIKNNFFEGGNCL